MNCIPVSGASAEAEAEYNLAVSTMAGNKGTLPRAALLKVHALTRWTLRNCSNARCANSAIQLAIKRLASPHSGFGCVRALQTRGGLERATPSAAVSSCCREGRLRGPSAYVPGGARRRELRQCRAPERLGLRRCKKAAHRINSFCVVAFRTAASGMPLSKVTSLPSC